MRIALSLLALAAAPVTLACSAFAAGSKATADGSVLITHSDDGEGNADPRMSYIEAADFPAGSQRPIWPDLEDFPRFIGTSRGPTYFPVNGQKETQPIGHIPQVPHTYAYMEANYGIQNEHQVSIGESTCSGVFGAAAIGTPNGTALLSINELSRIALERCNTSRAAVLLMGALAEEYGFYGPGSFEGTAETLLVGDKTEAFIFHMLPDDTQKSAIWVAQRVPDENVTVVANMFTVRAVDLTDSHNYLGSSNMHDIALKHKWWDGKGLLDFTHVFSAGEYAHQYYSGRRMWAFLRAMVPSMASQLPPEYHNLRDDPPQNGRVADRWWSNTYPWSVTPDKPVVAQDFIDAHRIHYEGTPYDTTKGMAAGPFGTPDRYMTVGTSTDPGTGSWERTIGLYRTTYTWVIESRAALPSNQGGVVWFGMADADKTCFVPMQVAQGAIPDAFKFGNNTVLDRSTAWWAMRIVQNLAQLKYSYMIEDIRAAQHSLESKGVALVAELSNPLKPLTPAEVQSRVFAHSEAVREAYLDLADLLMLKYADGRITTGTTAATIGQPLSYPRWWLEAVNFTDGPPRVGPSLTADGLKMANPVY